MTRWATILFGTGVLATAAGWQVHADTYKVYADTHDNTSAPLASGHSPKRVSAMPHRIGTPRGDISACLEDFAGHFVNEDKPDGKFKSDLKSTAHYSTSQAAREAHSKDASFHPAMLPDAVIFPHTTQDVIHIVNICRNHKVPIVAYGAGTSLEGHVLPVRGGVTVDFNEMKTVIAFHPDDLSITVEPGISYNELNEFLAPHGLFFPPDPGAGASIGGMVSTSCGGTNAVRFGTMKDNVLGLEVVLANGHVVQTRSGTRKSSAGYHLTDLFIGAEGTLGLVTAATLKLQPLPEASQVALIYFDTIAQGASAASDMTRSGSGIARCELMDALAIKAINISNDFNLIEGKNLLMVELIGTETDIKEQIAKIKEIADKHHGMEIKFSTNPEEKDDLWRIRKEAYWSTYSLRPGAEIWTTDVCVPISRLAECIEQSSKDFHEAGLLAPIVSHAGDGNFHMLILVDTKNQAELDLAAELNAKMIRRAISMGGTCTGEHGVGEGKREYLLEEYGEEGIALMRAIKEAMDPWHIMNPEKILLPSGFHGYANVKPHVSTGKDCTPSLTKTK